MDETQLATILHGLADTEAPPAPDDTGLAIRKGRRIRRWRLAIAGGSTLAVAAVAAVLATTLAGPGAPPVPVPGTGGTGGHATVASTGPGPGRSGAALATPPHAFNPLVPYASFGWLPPGYTTAWAGAVPGTTADSTYLTAGDSKGGFLELWVTAPGACTDSRSVLNCNYGNYGSSGQTPLTDPAPAVDGRQAYWGRSCRVVWQYAPDAWAILAASCRTAFRPPPSIRPEMVKVAAGVSYGPTTPLLFPFWTGAKPPGWRVSGSYLMEPPGAPEAKSLLYGPAADPSAVEIDVTPASGGGGCAFEFIQGQSRYVTVDGTRATLRTLSGKGWQQLCVGDVNGFMILVSLDITIQGAAVPGEAALGGALGIAKAIHILGTAPSGWTINPLR
jgi:hypothetical protein